MLAHRIELPVAVIVAAFFLITAFQTERLVQEHSNLASIREAQAMSIEQATKVRDRFQLLTAETAKLAESGNAGAKSALDQLRAQGVTVRPGGS
jgi:hypothetical protein